MPGAALVRGAWVVSGVVSDGAAVLFTVVSAVVAAGVGVVVGAGVVLGVGVVVGDVVAGVGVGVVVGEGAVVVAGGVLVARDQRRRKSYTPEEIRARLHQRVAESGEPQDD